MINMELSATGYGYNAIYYTTEFQTILKGLFACYKMMLNDNVEVSNDENKIRDKLLFDYLNNDNIKSTIGWNYLFNGEVLERSGGKVDIKIQSRNPLRETEAYYIIECKRINNKNTNGTSGLNAAYIKNGIYRFVRKNYSTNCGINAMIGFVVEAMDIHSNIQKINALLKKKFTDCNTTEYIQKESFIPNFEFHYSSKHDNVDKVSFILYHLMFDFSNNIHENKS